MTMLAFLLALMPIGVPVLSGADSFVILNENQAYRVRVAFVGETCSASTVLVTVHGQDERPVYAYARPAFAPPADDPDDNDPTACSAVRYEADAITAGDAHRVYDQLAATGYQLSARPDADRKVICHPTGYETNVCLASNEGGDRLLPLFTYGL